MPVDFKIIGKVFGKLKVLRYSHSDIYRNSHWLCVCECGNHKVIGLRSLKDGSTKSCGCFRDAFRKNRFVIKGPLIRSIPEYSTWASMKSRCTNPNNEFYSNWGGRGIKVCDRWLSFKNFYADMGPRPSKKHSLDRYPDNNGHYEPGNVRWATREQQSRNKRNNIWLEYNGKAMILADWAKYMGVFPNVIARRLKTKSFTEIAKKYEIKKNIYF